MEWLTYLIPVVMFLAGLGCMVLVVFQLPGVWILLAIATLIEFGLDGYRPADDTWTFGWPILAAAALAALIGEVIEFFAGASRRGMIGSLIGGIAGAFVFSGVFFFIPIFGTLCGVILGTFVGAIVGEMTDESATMKGTVKPAIGATIGRVLGTIGKVMTAMIAWGLLMAGAIF
ncbi:MAG: DUF456 domain-containing protein [Planctomycetota bacterium]|jgi:uncharacterized protein YqgC (DUF456 family)